MKRFYFLIVHMCLSGSFFMYIPKSFERLKMKKKTKTEKAFCLKGCKKGDKMII